MWECYICSFKKLPENQVSHIVLHDQTSTITFFSTCLGGLCIISWFKEQKKFKTIEQKLVLYLLKYFSKIMSQEKLKLVMSQNLGSTF